MIRNKDDTVLVEEESINLETTESGIYIIPLEKNKKNATRKIRRRQPDTKEARNFTRN